MRGEVTTALTPRETEVVRLIGEGLAGKQVAGRLGISVHTVETHRTRIHRKLGVRCVAGLVAYAFRRGLVACVAGLVMAAGAALGEVNLTLAWDPNPEPDISHYTLYYGNGSASYSAFTNVTGTNVTVGGLREDLGWFFAVTASNTAGLESDFSNEVSWNVTPPAPVALTVTVHVEGGPAPGLGPWTNVATVALTNVTSATAGVFRAWLGIVRR